MVSSPLTIHTSRPFRPVQLCRGCFGLLYQLSPLSGALGCICLRLCNSQSTFPCAVTLDSCPICEGAWECDYQDEENRGAEGFWMAGEGLEVGLGLLTSPPEHTQGTSVWLDGSKSSFCKSCALVAVHIPLFFCEGWFHSLGPLFLSNGHKEWFLTL